DGLRVIGHAGPPAIEIAQLVAEDGRERERHEGQHERGPVGRLGEGDHRSVLIGECEVRGPVTGPQDHEWFFLPTSRNPAQSSAALTVEVTCMPAVGAASEISAGLMCPGRFAFGLSSQTTPPSFSVAW